LPVAALVALAIVAQTYQYGRSWRECAAALWALAASEVVGLALVGLLHAREIQLIYSEFWPKGFAGLMPLRSLAVFGMTAALVRRQNVLAGRIAAVLAGLLVALIAFGVVWTRGQTLTETMLELAAGGVVLFAGLWWLEGFGTGLIKPADARGAGERREETDAVPDGSMTDKGPQTQVP
jgi:hypothetical protein